LDFLKFLNCKNLQGYFFTENFDYVEKFSEKGKNLSFMKVMEEAVKIKVETFFSFSVERKC